MCDGGRPATRLTTSWPRPFFFSSKMSCLKFLESSYVRLLLRDFFFIMEVTVMIFLLTSLVATSALISITIRKIGHDPGTELVIAASVRDNVSGRRARQKRKSSYATAWRNVGG